jgi:transcriptional regulator with XRE-family HTH domain
MNSFLTFGRWLKAQRRANDLTQNELARRAYCAEITIRKIEADDLRPSRELAALIVDALERAAGEQQEMMRWARQR